MVDSGSHFSPDAEELFDDYLCRCDAGEDADFDVLCREHPELAGQLRSLLAANDALNRLLPGPLEEDLSASADAPSELLKKLRARGRRGARYRSLGEISRGGMGVVQRVWDDELRRKLAMKVVIGRSGRSVAGTADVDPKSLERFLEEAQVTSQLDHPGIVPVHEIGLDASGSVYYTMRLVQGVSFRTIIEQVHSGSEGWNHVRALGVMLKVCEAMSYAHSKGVIHRDLKPANVMVGKFGEVYVMDWGLARVLAREDHHDLRIQPERPAAAPAPASAVESDRHDRRDSTPDSPLITMDGDVVGTPSYMSPEQGKGQLDKLGPHSDVYSVGAMLYQLISGQMPFVPPDARVTSRTILGRLIEGPPRPLSEIARNVPAELVAICDKAMSREIHRRYAGMQALADDLRAYIEGRVVQAYETGTWAETRKWIRRNRPLAASVASAVLVLVAGVVVSLLIARTSDRLKNDADVRSEALWAMEKFDEFQRQCSDWDHARSVPPPVCDWWLRTARDLVVGSGDRTSGRRRTPGLVDQERLLAEIRNVAIPVGAPELARVLGSDRALELEAKREELRAKQDELQWRKRMLGLESFPDLGAAQIDPSAPPLTDFDNLWQYVYRRVRPDWPRVIAAEIPAVVLARQMVEATRDDGDRHARAFETLAFALFRVHRFDEALDAQHQALRYVNHQNEKSFTDNLGVLESEIDGWRNVAAKRQSYEELDAEVKMLERRVADSNRRLVDSEANWRSELLMQSIAELNALRRRIARAEQTIESWEGRRIWDDAIAAIQVHPKYRGLRITPQIDLVPLGPDPDSSLWEFGYLPSGDQAHRGADHRIALSTETGIVFVLMPGGHVRMEDRKEAGHVVESEIEPFFLSKYEMTWQQWARLECDWPFRFMVQQWPRPKTEVSWDDCEAMLNRSASWLRLPTEEQWVYACRAGTTTPWWTGTAADELRGAELLADSREMPPELKGIGRFRANPFGLYDMLGNVSEWYHVADNVSRHRDDAHAAISLSPPSFAPYCGGSYQSVPAEVIWEGRDHEHDKSWGPHAYVGLRPARCLTP